MNGHGQKTTLPITKAAALHHVGTLDPADATGRGLEAGFLSASPHPRAWRRIARLGDAPTWRLRHPDRDLRLLEARAMSDDQERATAVWGFRHGLLVPFGVWTAEWYDDETEQTRVMEFKTMTAALEHLDAADPHELDGYVERASHAVKLVATTGLADIVGASADTREAASSSVSWDWVLQVLATSLDLDGVHFAEAFAPEAFSAPRTAIPPDRLSFLETIGTDDDPAEDPGAVHARTSAPETVGFPFWPAPRGAGEPWSATGWNARCWRVPESGSGRPVRSSPFPPNQSDAVSREEKALAAEAAEAYAADVRGDAIARASG